MTAYVYNSFPFELNLWTAYCVLARGRFYSLKFYPRTLLSLWSVLGFLLKFITRVLYMSFISYFMLFQIVNMPQVTSLFLLLPNLIYFLWNAYRHILMFRGAVTYMPLWDQTDFDRENWHLWDLMRKGSTSTFQTWEMPSHCPIKWMWATMRQNVGYSVILWCCGWTFFWVTFYLGIMLGLQRSCQDNTESFHTLLTQFFLMLTSYITIVHLSKLTNQHCYSAIK